MVATPRVSFTLAKSFSLYFLVTDLPSSSVVLDSNSRFIRFSRVSLSSSSRMSTCISCPSMVTVAAFFSVVRPAEMAE